MSTNNDLCKVKDCNNNDSNKHKFKKFTQLSKENAIRTNTYQNYNYLQIGDQLCFSHYLLIVEADRNKNKKRKSEEFNEINIRNDDDNTEFIEFDLSYFLNTNNNDKLNFNYWFNINIKYYDDKIILSKNDFDLLINKIKKIQKNIDEYEEVKKNNLNLLKEKIKLLSKCLYKRQR